MILEKLINKHIVIYEYNFGLKFFIKKEKNKITFLNKFKKPINLIDKTIYEDYQLLSTIDKANVPNNSFIKCKINDNKIYLESIQINKKHINSTSNQMYYANILNINSKKVLYEGKVSNQKEIENVIRRDNIAVLTKENLSLLNLKERTNSEYVQFINKDIIEYFTINTILYPLEKENKEEKYVELICNMFNEWIDHFNDDQILENSFDLNLNKSYIFNKKTLHLIQEENNKQLLQLFLTLFYEDKNWKGYFYDRDFIKKYSKLKNKITSKINSKRDLFFIK